MNILLTGSTGFLGSFLVGSLLSKGHRIFAIARRSNTQSAVERVYECLRFASRNQWGDNLKKCIEVFEGDITEADFGLKDKILLSKLTQEIDTIVHSAALAEITYPIETIRKINVDGTIHVLNFARKCKQLGRLQKAYYVSTVYVAGNQVAGFAETDLEKQQIFHNTYEQSKYESELALKNFQDIDISVFRPSMIIGDSIDGRTSHFRLFYQPLRHIVNGIFDEYPADLLCDQNLINIDTATEIIANLISSNEKTSIYHVISPKNISIQSFFSCVKRYFNCKLPEFIPIGKFNFEKLSSTQKRLLVPFVPYFNSRNNFNANKTLTISREAGLSLPEIDYENLSKIFSYCLKSGFIKKRG